MYNDNNNKCIALVYKHSLHKWNYYINIYFLNKILFLLLYLNFDISSNTSVCYAITKKVHKKWLYRLLSIS